MTDAMCAQGGTFDGCTCSECQDDNESLFLAALEAGRTAKPVHISKPIASLRRRMERVRQGVIDNG